MAEQDVVWTAGHGVSARLAARQQARLQELRYVLWPLGDAGAGALAFLLALVLRYRIAPVWDPRLAPSPPHMHLYAVAFWLYLPLLVAVLGLIEMAIDPGGVALVPGEIRFPPLVSDLVSNLSCLCVAVGGMAIALEHPGGVA